MRKIPKHFQDVTKMFPEVIQAYENLGAECRDAGPLSQKEQVLIKLGIAVGSRMEGSVHSQVRKALDFGIKPDEIRHAVLLALTAIGFPSTMAAMAWANDLLKAPKKAT